MRKTAFYQCPKCGNVFTSTTPATVNCCGEELQALVPKKASEEQKLNVEFIENDMYITSNHPMKKENYIHFVAMLTPESMTFRKLFPEWDLQIRIPFTRHGKMFWLSDDEGLLYRLI